MKDPKHQGISGPSLGLGELINLGLHFDLNRD
jgi:hypothetical protein